MFVRTKSVEGHKYLQVVESFRDGGKVKQRVGTSKDAVERALFEETRDLFTELSMVFFDTTSLYFEGAGGQSIGQYGHSKDHRPDLVQMIVGAALDGNGRPMSCELWPGNHAGSFSSPSSVSIGRPRVRLM